jgi:hypothetical protein
VFGERRLELRDSDLGLELAERPESKKRIRQRDSGGNLDLRRRLELRRRIRGRDSGRSIECSLNVLDQRPGASDLRLLTGAPSPGSLHLTG